MRYEVNSLRLAGDGGSWASQKDGKKRRMTLTPRPSLTLQGGVLRYLGTGNRGLDILSTALQALGIRLAVPNATITGNAVLDMIIFASIPVSRSNILDDCKRGLTELTKMMYEKWQNRYITTIEFEEEVRIVWTKQCSPMD